MSIRGAAFIAGIYEHPGRDLPNHTIWDIHAEVARMTDLGVEFVSEPVKLGDFWQAYAHDIDGNVFSLRQAIDADSPYSIPQLEL